MSMSREIEYKILERLISAEDNPLGITLSQLESQAHIRDEKEKTKEKKHPASPTLAIKSTDTHGGTEIGATKKLGGKTLSPKEEKKTSPVAITQAQVLHGKFSTDSIAELTLEQIKDKVEKMKSIGISSDAAKIIYAEMQFERIYRAITENESKEPKFQALAEAVKKNKDNILNRIQYLELTPDEISSYLNQITPLAKQTLIQGDLERISEGLYALGLDQFTKEILDEIPPYYAIAYRPHYFERLGAKVESESVHKYYEKALRSLENIFGKPTYIVGSKISDAIKKNHLNMISIVNYFDILKDKTNWLHSPDKNTQPVAEALLALGFTDKSNLPPNLHKILADPTYAEIRTAAEKAISDKSRDRSHSGIRQAPGSGEFKERKSAWGETPTSTEKKKTVVIDTRNPEYYLKIIKEQYQACVDISKHSQDEPNKAIKIFEEAKRTANAAAIEGFKKNPSIEPHILIRQLQKSENEVEQEAASYLEKINKYADEAQKFLKRREPAPVASKEKHELKRETKSRISTPKPQENKDHLAIDELKKLYDQSLVHYNTAIFHPEEKSKENVIQKQIDSVSLLLQRAKEILTENFQNSEAYKTIASKYIEGISNILKNTQDLLTSYKEMQKDEQEYTQTKEREEKNAAEFKKAQSDRANLFSLFTTTIDDVATHSRLATQSLTLLKTEQKPEQIKQYIDFIQSCWTYAKNKCESELKDYGKIAGKEFILHANQVTNSYLSPLADTITVYLQTISDTLSEAEKLAKSKATKDKKRSEEKPHLATILADRNEQKKIQQPKFDRTAFSFERVIKIVAILATKVNDLKISTKEIINIIDYLKHAEDVCTTNLKKYGNIVDHKFVLNREINSKDLKEKTKTINAHLQTILNALAKAKELAKSASEDMSKEQKHDTRSTSSLQEEKKQADALTQLKEYAGQIEAAFNSCNNPPADQAKISFFNAKLVEINRIGGLSLELAKEAFGDFDQDDYPYKDSSDSKKGQANVLLKKMLEYQSRLEQQLSNEVVSELTKYVSLAKAAYAACTDAASETIQAKTKEILSIYTDASTLSESVYGEYKNEDVFYPQPDHPANAYLKEIKSYLDKALDQAQKLAPKEEKPDQEKEKTPEPTPSSFDQYGLDKFMAKYFSREDSEDNFIELNRLLTAIEAAEKAHITSDRTATLLSMKAIDFRRSVSHVISNKEIEDKFAALKLTSLANQITDESTTLESLQTIFDKCSKDIAVFIDDAGKTNGNRKRAEFNLQDLLLRADDDKPNSGAGDKLLKTLVRLSNIKQKLKDKRTIINEAKEALQNVEKAKQTALSDKAGDHQSQVLFKSEVDIYNREIKVKPISFDPTKQTDHENKIATEIKGITGIDVPRTPAALSLPLPPPIDANTDRAYLTPGSTEAKTSLHVIKVDKKDLFDKEDEKTDDFTAITAGNETNKILNNGEAEVSAAIAIKHMRRDLVRKEVFIKAYSTLTPDEQKLLRSSDVLKNYTEYPPTPKGLENYLKDKAKQGACGPFTGLFGWNTAAIISTKLVNFYNECYKNKFEEHAFICKYALDRYLNLRTTSDVLIPIEGESKETAYMFKTVCEAMQRLSQEGDVIIDSKKYFRNDFLYDQSDKETAPKEEHIKQAYEYLKTKYYPEQYYKLRGKEQKADATAYLSRQGKREFESAVFKNPDKTGGERVEKMLAVEAASKKVTAISEKWDPIVEGELQRAEQEAKESYKDGSSPRGSVISISRGSSFSSVDSDASSLNDSDDEHEPDSPESPPSRRPS